VLAVKSDFSLLPQRFFSHPCAGEATRTERSAATRILPSKIDIFYALHYVYSCYLYIYIYIYMSHMATYNMCSIVFPFLFACSVYRCVEQRYIFKYFKTQPRLALHSEQMRGKTITRYAGT
jgi:hypothetical protein